MKPLLSLFLAPILLSSCHYLSGPAAQAQLTPTAIYDIDSVRLAAGSGDDKAARKQMLAAVNAYKNEKDPAKSIPLFKKSILTKPNAVTYYELGSALLDHGDYTEAAQALHIAEKLEYKPLSNVMFKLAAACTNAVSDGESREHQGSLVTKYMELAIQMGYAQPESFRSNAAFKSFKNDYEFHSAYHAALEGGLNVKKPEQALWEEYKGEFGTVDLPLTINAAWIKAHPLEKDINFDYERFVPEMRTNRFAREVGNEFYYFAVVRKDTAYTALLYAGKDASLEDDGETHAPLYFFLVTYDPGGKIIDKLLVAGQQSFNDLVRVFTMQPNYTFEVRDFKNVYSKNPDQAGYGSDNPIVSTDEQGVAHYKITANGRFEKTDAPLAMR